jgi:hypothetical protein
MEPAASHTNVHAHVAASDPIAQCFPADWALVQFQDCNGGNAGTDLPGIQLSTSSPWHRAGTDYWDVGANVPALLAAVSGGRAVTTLADLLGR